MHTKQYLTLLHVLAEGLGPFIFDFCSFICSYVKFNSLIVEMKLFVENYIGIFKLAKYIVGASSNKRTC